MMGLSLSFALKQGKRADNILKNFFEKDHAPKDLNGVVYEFQCGLFNESYYGKFVRHLNVRIGKYIRVSPLSKVSPKKSNYQLPARCKWSYFAQFLFYFFSCMSFGRILLWWQWKENFKWLVYDEYLNIVSSIVHMVARIVSS